MENCVKRMDWIKEKKIRVWEEAKRNLLNQKEDIETRITNINRLIKEESW